jgi:two-component system, NtrC family, response regulator HydG
MVDDDTSLVKFVKEFLETHGFRVVTANSGSEAVQAVAAHPERFSVVVLDYRMPGLNGAATTKALLALNSRLPIVIYSGDTTRDAVLLSSRSGAFTFVDKDESPAIFLSEVRRAALRYENDALTLEQGASAGDASAFGMVGSSDAIRKIAYKISKLSDKSGPVLVLGESGTGKELVARALHGAREGVFRAVNCADYLMSSGTARSELFGHVKGSFTGADQDKAGIFEQAKKGTVFLDEVYSLPPDTQVGLLRVLQERSVVRLGGSTEVPVSCRFVAAAKPDLIQEISARRFKSDLFYRISQNIIEVPSLRDRMEDIDLLVSHFCKKWSAENGDEKVFVVGAIERLKRYSWPGNIRELENVVYSVLNITERREVRADDLGSRFRSTELSSDRALKIEAGQDLARAEFLDVLSNSKSARVAALKLGIATSTVLRRLERYGYSRHEVIGRGLRAKRRSGHK